MSLHFWMHSANQCVIHEEKKQTYKQNKERKKERKKEKNNRK